MSDTENIDKLVTDLGRYQLIVTWKPADDQPLRFIFVIVNGKILVRDRVQADAPVVFQRLPSPDAHGQFRISWALSPEVPLEAIGVGFGDTETKIRKKVSETSESDRGKIWHGFATVKLDENDFTVETKG
jgi:hypothetical protein